MPKPLARLMRTIPEERPSCKKTATAASLEILVDRMALVIPSEPKTTTTAATHNGTMSK